MKTASIVLRSAIAVCFALVMSSASCDLFDKVDDVTFEVTLDHTFNVNETNKGQDVEYALRETLDAADVSAEFAKYKDKIKSITVSSVTYEVKNCETNTTLTDGAIGFSAENSTTPAQIASLGAENLKLIENQVKTLIFSQANIDALSNLLKNDKMVNIYVTGTLAETPAKFDVEVIVKASITADAL